MSSQNPNNFNETIITEFRANEGKVGGYFANSTLLLLTTTGAKSGQSRTLPLAYTTDGSNFVIMASNGGGPTNPAWYHNVQVHPLTTVEIGHERFQAQAVVTEELERERLFTKMATQMPGFAEYQRNTSRKIPVIVLKRID